MRCFKMIKKDATDFEILRYAEIKRIAENINKKELSDILGMNSSFYNNCLHQFANPSETLVKKLKEYLKMNTSEVYFNIYKNRENPTLVRTKSFIDSKGKAKEEFTEKSLINIEMYNKCLEEIAETQDWADREVESKWR